MDGMVFPPGSRQRPASFALVEILLELCISAAAAVRRGLAAYAHSLRMSKVRREMQGLSDHYLRDIGLSRHEINRVFR